MVRKIKKETNIETKRHSLAHILAMAVLELYLNAKLGIGPAIENGFYYDFDFGANKISDNDLIKIEEKMRELIAKDLKFKKEKIDFIEAKKLFKNQSYKLELIKELNKAGKLITVYKTFLVNPKPQTPNHKSCFTDLCSGPHIFSTADLSPDAFKLTKIAGAYWKGSEKNPQLTRIYGLAFDSKQELDEHLKMLEIAELCDHRNLGERLEYFMIDEEIGKGLPLWLPKGYAIRKKLEDYIYNLEKKNDYLHVLTPHIAKEGLYKKSGHLAHYKEDMYAPINIEGENYYLKPMNCPHHHAIFKRTKRSYKEFPLRIAEFGTVYRFERSGVLSGMQRVRGFTQNDAHIYLNEENLESEIVAILNLNKKAYEDLAISDYWYRLSLPDFKNKEKFGDIKNKKMWEVGSFVLKKVLKDLKLDFIEGIGEASFYGPKIDIQIKNIYGKEDSIATVQVDYYSAGKFNLNYIDKDGKEKPVVIIHRAIFGSFDRVFALFLEKTCGNLPFWFAPIQVKVLAVSEKQKSYVASVAEFLKEKNIDAETGDANETLGKRIRESEMQKIPYILVVGDKEAEAKTVSVRERGKGDLGAMKIGEFLEMLPKKPY